VKKRLCRTQTWSKCTPNETKTKNEIQTTKSTGGVRKKVGPVDPRKKRKLVLCLFCCVSIFFGFFQKAKRAAASSTSQKLVKPSMSTTTAGANGIQKIRKRRNKHTSRKIFEPKNQIKSRGCAITATETITTKTTSSTHNSTSSNNNHPFKINGFIDHNTHNLLTWLNDVVCHLLLNTPQKKKFSNFEKYQAPGVFGREFVVDECKNNQYIEQFRAENVRSRPNHFENENFLLNNIRLRRQKIEKV
jgi:hypothetical protein